MGCGNPALALWPCRFHLLRDRRATDVVAEVGMLGAPTSRIVPRTVFSLSAANEISLLRISNRVLSRLDYAFGMSIVSLPRRRGWL